VKPILTEIVNRLSDLAASLNGSEGALIHNQQLTAVDIRDRFDNHKGIAESHLLHLRGLISSLPD
jgi:hypothetical protein